ncbi:hypothetical protein TOPH_01708 [Tolypocladium ophioglossoides CBS 100239]|uniref:Uncharacterized protein n=1 Tax=Tolypocladium ophioglossoides (strain CBS 100239) TaxID=1163406 RepID=A0A0L0NHL8_TOLOC|nr:hypothetical protein TOPH_01708 [Tolypocladium ophioglossoides CBS 100239]
MKHLPSPVLFLLFAISRAVWALKVTPGSRCAASCLDSPTGNPFKASDSTTKSTDVSCKDLDYSTTDTGIKFRECLECLQTSKKVDKEESDLKWYICEWPRPMGCDSVRPTLTKFPDNLRYTITTCLFSEPAPPPNGTVHSPCDIGQACKPLKAPLTDDGVKPVPQNAWGYCTANDGAFMGSNLSPCISCLQATQGEAYLSNFMAALETGCKQDPEDGHVLSISGSLFSTNAINITDPSADNQDNQEGGLSPSAIAGIVIGVVFVFLAAAALFAVHWRREKTFNKWHHAQHFENHSTSPGPYLPHGDVKLSQAYRRYYTGSAFNDKAAPPYTLSGDYYDHVEAEIQASGMNHASDRRSRNSRLGSDMPTHQAYRPQTVSRAASLASPERPPSPPKAVHKPERTNTPDSFAVQAYLTAAEDCAQLAAQAPPATELKPRVSRISKIPSITLPSLHKLRIPKKYKPAKASLETMTTDRVHRGHEMDISGPVMGQDARFHERPMGEPAAMAGERPSSPRQHDVIYYNDEYIEVPLRSGKSTLYGY